MADLRSAALSCVGTWAIIAGFSAVSRSRLLFRRALAGKAGQPIPAVGRRPERRVGSPGNEGRPAVGGADVGVASLDRLEIGGVAEPGGLVQVAGVPPKVRVIDDPAQVGAENPVIGRVEPGQGDVKPNVRVRQPIPEQVSLTGQADVELIEAGEERVERLLVRLLRPGETAFVDAVVDLVEEDLVQRIDLRSEILGVEVRRSSAVKGAPRRLEVVGQPEI